MEESYRKLLEDIMRINNGESLEYSIIEAHKVVAAKRKFEQVMDCAHTVIVNRRIANGF